MPALFLVTGLVLWPHMLMRCRPLQRQAARAQLRHRFLSHFSTARPRRLLWPYLPGA